MVVVGLAGSASYFAQEQGYGSYIRYNWWVLPTTTLLLVVAFLVLLFETRAAKTCVTWIRHKLGARYPRMTDSIVILLFAVVGGLFGFGYLRSLDKSKAHLQLLRQESERAAHAATPAPDKVPPTPESPPQTTTSAEPAPPPLEPSLGKQPGPAFAAAKAQPLFRSALKKGPIQGRVAEYLELRNDGEELDGFSIQQVSLLEIRREDLSPPETRYMPFKYFFEQDYTGEKTGVLVRLWAFAGINFSLGSSPKNTKDELARLMAEIQGEFGSDTHVRRRLYLRITYVDVTGVSHVVDHDAAPEQDYFGPDSSRPPFDLQVALDEMNVTEHFWDLTAPQIRERWQSYPTYEQLAATR